MLKSTYLTLAFRHDLLVDTPLRWMQGIYENSHSPTCDRKIAATCLINFVIFFLINFQVIHHERIHALAKPTSRQTQDNSYSKFAFAKPSALSHTPNDVVAIIFRLVAATPFVAVNLSLLQTHIFFYTSNIHNEKQLN
ncbi:hypothetical protein TNCV_1182101 [Trichonephila clavipes]|nr:hypothetical protein TNCV_1182101 [Trichonephila clavipes]